jgi:phosphatidylethanolamine N-methyltransferase
VAGRPASPPASQADKLAYCFETGRRFRAPATRNTLALLLRFWQPGSFVTLLMGCALIWVGLPDYACEALGDAGLGWLPYAGAASDWQLLLVATFWRIQYNVVLGAILRLQSETKFLTRWLAGVKAVPLDEPSTARTLVNWLLRDTAGCADPLAVYPAGFNAWMLNMQWVNVILPLDVLAFVVVVVRSFKQTHTCADIVVSVSAAANYTFPGLAETSPVLCTAATTLAYVFGVLLAGASVLGKHSAFKVIGHYAWFWGDFFYGLDLELKFDGIFDIVPHPMYTVGYGWMYGCALVTGSAHVTALAFASHLMQIGFLVFVEDPHIHKLYGSGTAPVPVSDKLRSAEEKLMRRGRAESEDNAAAFRYVDSNVFVVKNFDLFRASDWQLIIICILMMTVYGLASVRQTADGAPLVPDAAILAIAMAARAVFTIVEALILRGQAQTRFWTKHFVEQGQSLGKAFTEYKRLQNALDTTMNMCFYLAALRFLENNYRADRYSALLQSHGIAYVAALLLGSVSLILVGIWAVRSVYDALGDQGWFYGDFFLPNRDGKDRSLVYDGIYRYVNNPDVLLGKLWLYGMALLVMSVEMGVLALFSHAIAWFFLIVIEEPHMKAFYENKKIRKHSTALTKQLKTQVLPRLAASARAQYYRVHSWGDKVLSA